MITAVTIAYPHGVGSKPKVITGPEVDYPKQLADFKAACASKVNDKWSRIELWTSGAGASKSIKFISPDEVKRREKAAEAEAKKIKEEEASKAKASEASKPKL